MMIQKYIYKRSPCYYITCDMFASFTSVIVINNLTETRANQICRELNNSESDWFTQYNVHKFK